MPGLVMSGLLAHWTATYSTSPVYMVASTISGMVNVDHCGTVDWISLMEAMSLTE